MTLVDSSGWVELFSDGPLADRYEKHLLQILEVVVPTVVLYEVYKKFKREFSEELASIVRVKMQASRVIPLTEKLAIDAAEIALQHRLSVADSIIYATALQEKVKLVTSDKDLKDLPHVVYYPKL